ncbi:MAG TPA: succinate--CoA ligase subunit alpha [Bacillota bacterium]|nr:succinate--CoA ligase subunit alpha [Bacillota bacterium]
MSVLVDEKTRVVVTGATGRQGSFHLAQMLEFGTRVVAGVTPGRQGQEVSGVPVYDTVEAAVEKHGANAAVVFVPGGLAKDSAMECIDAGVPLVVVISEHVPLHDAMVVNAFAAERGTTIVGPNTYGLCSPSARCKIGIPPNSIFQAGPVGVVARSGTLSYELVASLTEAGLGQTSVVGMGGDRVAGVNFIDMLKRFERDPETGVVVLIGEIGGTAEEEAAEYIKGMSKPVVAYLAGKSAPPGKRMGHAGAIIERGRGTFESKVAALEAGGAKVAQLPWEVAPLVKAAFTQ